MSHQRPERSYNQDNFGADAVTMRLADIDFVVNTLVASRYLTQLDEDSRTLKLCKEVDTLCRSGIDTQAEKHFRELLLHEVIVQQETKKLSQLYLQTVEDTNVALANRCLDTELFLRTPGASFLNRQELLSEARMCLGLLGFQLRYLDSSYLSRAQQAQAIMKAVPPITGANQIIFERFTRQQVTRFFLSELKNPQGISVGTVEKQVAESRLSLSNLNDLEDVLHKTHLWEAEASALMIRQIPSLRNPLVNPLVIRHSMGHHYGAITRGRLVRVYHGLIASGIQVSKY